MRKILFFSIFFAFLSILFWTGETPICVGAGSEDLNLTISSAKCELQPVSPAPYYGVDFDVKVHAKGGITSYSATPFRSLPTCECAGSDPDWNCRCKGNLDGAEYTGNNFLSVSIYNKQGQRAVAASEITCSNTPSPSPPSSPDSNRGAPSVRITDAKCGVIGVGPGYTIAFDADVYAEGGISDYSITGFPLSKTPTCYSTGGDAPNFKYHYHCSQYYPETESIQGQSHNIVVNIYDRQNRRAFDSETVSCSSSEGGDSHQDNLEVMSVVTLGLSPKLLLMSDFSMWEKDEWEKGEKQQRGYMKKNKNRNGYDTYDFATNDYVGTLLKNEVLKNFETGAILSYTANPPLQFPVDSSSDGSNTCTRSSDCGRMDQWSCINGQCQRAICGDGFCNMCEVSPCPEESETAESCPDDCGNSQSPPTNPNPDSNTTSPSNPNPPNQEDGQYVPLYNYERHQPTPFYCSQTHCNGESECEESPISCQSALDAPPEYKYKHTRPSLKGFKNFYNMNDARNVCGIEYVDPAECGQDESTLYAHLTTLSRGEKPADMAAFPDGFRIFIPPGAVYAGATVYMPIDAVEGLIVRYKQAPDAEYLGHAFGDIPWDKSIDINLDLLEQRDAYLANSGGHAYVLPAFTTYTPLAPEDSGWLYIRKLPFSSGTIHDVKATIDVNLDAYLEWYNKVRPCTDSNQDPSAGYCWDTNGNPVKLSSINSPDSPEATGDFRSCDESLDWEQCVEPDYKFFQFSLGTCSSRAHGDISYQDGWCQDESYGDYSCCSDIHKTFGCYSFKPQGTSCGTNQICDGSGHCVLQNASSDTTSPTVTAKGFLQKNGNIQVNINAYDDMDDNPVIYYSVAHNGIDPGEPTRKGINSVGIGSSSDHTSIVVRYYAIDASGNKSQVYDYTYNKPGNTDCLGDINGDSKIDHCDLAIMARDWGQPSSSDLNNDGTTDIEDLMILADELKNNNDCK